MDKHNVRKEDFTAGEHNNIFNLFFENSNGLLCIADVNGYFQKLNPEWEKVLGYNLSEIEGKAFIDFVHPDDVEKTVEATKQLANNQSVQNFTNRYRHKNGTYRWIEWRSFPVGDLICADARDITEQIETEQKLKDSEEINKVIASMAYDYVTRMDVSEKNEINLAYVSENFEKVTGLKFNEALGTEDRKKLYHPDDYPKVQEYVRKLLTTGKPQSLECRTIIKGKNRWIKVDSKPVVDQKTGKVTMFYSAVKDITQKKETEEALKKSEELLKSITHNIPGIVFRFYIDIDSFIFNYISDNSKKYFELDNDNLDTYYQRFINILPEDDQSEFISSIQDAVMNNSNWNYEGKFIRKSTGELNYFHGTAQFRREGDKHIFDGILMDITDRKLTEIELQKSEIRYRTLIEDQVDLVSRYLPDTTLTYVNDAYCRFYGKSREELIGESYLFMIAPEFREYVKQETLDLVQNNGSVKGEYLNLRHDGKQRWIQWAVKCITDESGKVAELQAVGRDVSEIKNTEEALKQSEELLRGMTLNIPGTVFQFKADEKGNYGFNYISNNSIHYLGLDNQDRDSYLDRFIKCLPEEIHKDFLDSIDYAVKNEFKWKYEGVFNKPGADKRFFRCIAEPRKIDDKLVFDGIYMDVTEAKEAERELERTKALFSASVMQAPIPMVIASAPDNVIRLANNATAEILQIDDLSQYIDKPLMEIDVIWEDFDEEGKPIPLSELPLTKALYGVDTKNRELSVRRKDGTLRYTSVSSITVRDNKGDIIAAYLIFPDITDRKLAEEALQKSAEQYKVITNTSMDGFVITNMKGDILDVNDAYCRMVEYSREELMKMSALELEIIDSPEDVRLRINKAKTKSLLFESQHRTKSGKIIDVEISMTFMPETEQVFVFLRDITERKRAKKALEESEERYRNLVEEASIGIVVTIDYKVIFCNRKESRLFGYKNPLDMRGHHISEFIKQQDLKELGVIRNKIAEGKSMESLAIFRGIRPDGKELVIEGRAIPFIYEGKEAILSFHSDITERIKAETELQNRAKEMESLMKSMTNAFVMWEPVMNKNNKVVDVRFLYINDAYEKIAGFKLEQVQGKRVLKVWPDTEHEWFDVFSEVVNTGHPKSFEMFFTPTNALYSCHAYLPAGTSDRICVVFEDITERKHAEELLRQNEEKYRSIVEGLDEAFYRMTLPAGKYELFSKSVIDVFGYSSEDFMNNPLLISEIIHPDFHDYFAIEFEKLLKGEIAPTYEYKIIDPEGKERWIIQSNKGIFDNKGKITGIEGLCRDITERKNAEIKIKQLVEMQETILSTMTVGVCYIKNREIQWVNKVVNEIFGYDPEEVIGKNTGFIYRSKTDYEKIGEAYRRLEKGEMFYTEMEYRKKNGELLDVYMTGRAINPKQPEVGSIWMLQDITERKKAEKEFKQLANLHQTILDTVNVGFVFLKDRKVQWANHSFINMFGYQYEEIIGRETFYFHTTDEEAEIIGKKAIEVLSGGGTYSIETQGKRKNKSTFFMHMVGKTINPNNLSDGSIWMIEDITERKNFELVLKKREAILKATMESINDGMLIVDSKGKITHSNTTFSEIFSIPDELLVTRDDETLINYAKNQLIDPEAFIKDVERIYNSKETTEDLLYFKDKRIIERLSYPLLEDSPVRGRVWVFRDITEKKQMEDERLSNIEFLESLDQVNRTIQSTNDIQVMMKDVLEIVKSIYNCDRAFLLYPCDPETPKWHVPMEVTNPEYPGAFQLGEWIPTNDNMRKIFTDQLKTDDPMELRLGKEMIPGEEPWAQFQIKSVLIITIHPKVGKAWQFGMHQCSHIREWTQSDKRLFKELGRRLGDSLTTFLMYRDLNDNKEFLNKIIENIPNTIFVKDVETLKYLRLNEAGEKLLGYSRDEFIGKTDYDLFPEEVAVYFEQKDKEVLKLNALVDIPEERIINRNNKEFFLHTKKIPIMDENGNPKYLLGIAENITERKKAADELIRSQKLLSESQRVANMGSWEYIIHDDILIWNEQTYNIYGIKDKKFKLNHRNSIDLTHPDDRKLVEDNFIKATKTGVLDEFEFKIVQPGNKKIRNLRIIGKVEFKDKKPYRAFGILQDITERKKAEEEFKQLANLHQTILDTTPIGLIFLEDRKIKWSNPAFNKMLGYEGSEIVGTETSKYYLHEDDFIKTGNEAYQALKNDQIYTKEVEARKKDGTPIWTILTGKAVNPGDPLKGSIWMHQDISKQKKAEEEFRQLAGTHQTVLDTVTMGLVLLKETKLQWSNNAFTAMFGYTKEEELDKPVNFFYKKPEEYDNFREDALHTLLRNEAYSTEIEAKRKDGSEFLLRMTGKIIDPENYENGSIWMLEDITESKKAEKEFKQLAELHQTILDTLTVGLSFVKERKLQWTNSSFYKMYDYNEDEIHGVKTFELYAYESDYKRIGTEGYSQLAKGGLYTTELLAKGKKGNTFWVNLRGKAIDPKNLEEGSVWMLEDITESKKAEKEFKQLAGLHQTVLDTVTASLIYVKSDKFEWVNNAFYNIYGYAPNEIIGKSVSILDPDEENFKNTRREALYEISRGIVHSMERISRKKDGTKFWVNLTGKAINPGNLDEGMIWMLQDITERKKNEEELLKNQKMLSESQRIAKIGSWDWDMITDEVIWSKETYSIFEFDENDPPVTLKNLQEFVHPDDRDYMKKIFNNAFINKKLEDFECRTMIKSGNYKIIYGMGEFLFDNKGNPMRLYGIVQDITEKKKAEENLLTIKERLQSFMDSATDSMSIYNADFNLVEINKASLSYLPAGTKKENILGKNITEFYPRFKTSKVFEHYKKVIQTGKPSYLEDMIKLPDKTLWFNTKVFKSGNDLGIIASNITAQKIVEEKMKNLNVELESKVKERTFELEQANKDLEAFAYSVSHDLRAPLRHIDGFVRLLNSKITGQEKDTKKYIERIINSSGRMSVMIDELLKFSRLGRQEMKIAEVNLNEIVDEVINYLKPEIKQRKISWRISKLPSIYGDEFLLKVAFENLISNAVKYTSKESEAVIEVGNKPVKGERVTLYIRDNGVGFDMNYSDKLFGVFQRLHTNEEFEGIGVGLAIVKQVITKHNGYITFKSKVNEGTTFFIDLPIKQLNE